MRRRLTITIPIALVMLVLAASASASAVPLGSIATSYDPPRVVVDSSGQGYATWADGGSGEALDYCRLTPGSSTCTTHATFPYPAGPAYGTDSGNSPVFTTGGQLALLDSRCCLTSNQKFLYVSSDAGKTFAAPTPIVVDGASGMPGNLLDLPPAALFAGSPEQLLTSDNGSVTGGGSIQATGLTTAADPGWYTPSNQEGTLSESVGLSGSSLVAVYTQPTSPSYTVWWVKYTGSGDPDAAANWTAPVQLSPLPSLDSNAQLSSGPAGIFVARSIATAGDNEELAVQKFTGSGWSTPEVITNAASGERFAIAETPAGIVYVIWKDTSGALEYKIATSTAATSFGSALTLPTTGDVEFPQIAVDASGAGWATWTSEGSSTQAFAVPIPPAPRSTTVPLAGGGSVSLGTPRSCVAPGATFTVTLGFVRSRRKGSVYIKIGQVAFSVEGSHVKTVTHAPYRATLTLKASAKRGSKVTVRARATIRTHHGRPPTKSIYAKVTVCS